MNKNYWYNFIVYSAFVFILCSILLFWYSFTKNSTFLSEKSKESTTETIINCNNYINWFYEIHPKCIIDKKLPELNLTDIIRETWNQISDFSVYYQPFEKEFDYYWAKPIFTTSWSLYLQENEKSHQLISEAIEKNQTIKISYNELAQYYASHLSYFIADKDISKLWKCSKTNYLLAFNSLNDYILNPGNSLNMNKELIKISDYCKWLSESEYSFYWWVCGFISQLFRVSLLDPDINITKRFNHNERFVQYYWEIIWWDDAAVYENTKQFEIKNIWNSDIIFKTRHEWDKTLLIAISRPTKQRVNISKENINWMNRAIHLEKKIYNNNSKEPINIEEFDSYYTKKTYEYR